jgi:hypothetical protein
MQSETKIEKTFQIFIFFLFIIIFSACLSKEESFTMNDFSLVDKIDVHVHINSENAAFVNQAQSDNFKLLTVNVDYSDFPPIEEQYKIAINLSKKYPESISFASTFYMSGWDEPDWQGKTIAQLEESFREGAVAVKVWKNIGMDFKNKNGQLVMIDDPGLDSIFKNIYINKITLIGHQGEPKDCWSPIEKMTVNYLREYFTEHPQYHMHLHPEFPSYEEQILARNRMLEKNPNLRFMGAHLASLEWSVDEITKFLDHFPNAVVDMAARMSHLMYQSNQNRERVRDFFIKYQNRILYATDLVMEPETDTDEYSQEIHKRWIEDWKFLSTDSVITVPDFEGTFRGLVLPKEVIIKIYRLNAQKTFPKAWRANKS